MPGSLSGFKSMLIQIKPVELSPVDPDIKAQFRLDTLAGRDLLQEQIQKDIDEWCQLQYDSGPRSHLGASIIGHECERYIWFSFRWMYYEKYSGRMQRLFQRGHLEETRVTEWLRGIGFTVHQFDEQGQQYRVIFSDKHGGGSSDGVGEMPTRYGKFEPLLLEFKTQKDKKFNILQGSGVQKEKPMHFIQASIYGRRHGLQYCLYIAVNKEDDDLDVEVIELDWDLADAEMNKADKIITSEFPPRRISDNPSFWKCKYCPALGICHLGAPVERNCRSCYYAVPVENGEWTCNYWKNTIPKDFIPKGCDQWHQIATR